MEYFIFILYLVFFCSFFYSYNAQKNTGLSISFILFLFLLKVAAGCANLYIHYHDFLSNDIRFYFEQSILELIGFRKQPAVFVHNWLFNWGDIVHHLNLFDANDMKYLSDLGPLIYSKYMNLVNIFTLGSLYADVIFFNVIYFLGLLQLYKVFYQLQPQKKWLFVIAIFFIPSVLFWCSGIHKDGFVLAAIGFICYYTIKYMHTKRMVFLGGLFPSLLLLFMSRYFIFLCFAPPYLMWVLMASSKKRVFKFVAAYAVIVLVFFTAGNFTSIEPLEIIVAKQRDFFLLRGYSDMATPVLEPTFMSFLKNFPTAMNHIFLRPYLHPANPWKYQVAGIDSWLIFSWSVVMIIFITRRNMQQLFFLMLLFFSLSMYLFIGYTTPNCGALLRYKSEITALLLPALVALSEVPFFKRLYSNIPESFSA